MRTIITLSKDHLTSLQELCNDEKISRAELIRRAISLYIEKKYSLKKSPDVFGLWKKRKINSLKYEDSLRHEWSL